MDILIKNGIIITSTKQFESDILIRGGRILRIENNIQVPVDKVIDARGLFVLPGGIDPHVHLNLPTPAGPSSDDFESGSIAALYGGTTTLLDFVTPSKGQSLSEALKQRVLEAKKSFIDHSFHVSPVEWRETTIMEIEDCIRAGITSFKVYMAYKGTVGLNDDDFFKVLQTIGKAGGVVTVHCELGDEVEEMRKRFASESHIEPLYHCLSRPPELEALAVKKAIEMAQMTNCRLYIVHVSAKESLTYIRRAQSKGQRVYAETCPHYLLLDDSKYFGEFEQTVPYTISPPLRKKEDSQALWEALSNGIISTIGTDHCPFTLTQKAVGKDDFRLIPNGAGSIEHRLELLYTYGVLENRITLNQMVDLYSTQPAKLFGLYPQKGEIMVGADADIVLWNPESERDISAKTHHQKCDINIFEGFRVKGIVETVIAGGYVKVEKGKIVDTEIRGKYLLRKISK